MNIASLVSVGAPFGVASLISLVVSETAWALWLYYVLVFGLAGLNAALAVRVLFHTGLKTGPIVGFRASLVIAQSTNQRNELW